MSKAPETKQIKKTKTFVEEKTLSAKARELLGDCSLCVALATLSLCSFFLEAAGLDLFAG